MVHDKTQLYSQPALEALTSAGPYCTKYLVVFDIPACVHETVPQVSVF